MAIGYNDKQEESEFEDKVIHIKANRLRELSGGALELRSHDFH